MINYVQNVARRFSADQRAAAMVEFAIIAPLLFILIFGIIDFGRVFFLYNNLTNAARDGARSGAVLPVDVSQASITATTLDRINDGQKSAGLINVDYPTAAGGVRSVRVRIQQYPFAPVTFLVIKSAIKLNVTAEFRYELQ